MEKNEIFQMSKIEFYEAMSRVSEEASLVNTLFYQNTENWG